MYKRLSRNQIVLVGIGHTNAHIVRMWRMNPLPDTALVCVSDFPVATYSGMLPGVLAGQYPPGAMQIDLVRLCAAAGCRLVLGEFSEIDRSRRLVHFPDRPPLDYDWLSIGTGSRPGFSGVVVATGAAIEEIKPMQTFLQRLQGQLERLAEKGCTAPRIAVVGGGVGSIEIAFCLNARLRTSPRNGASDGLDLALGQLQGAAITLVTASRGLARDLAPATVRRLESELSRRSVGVILDERVVGVEPGKVVFESGRSLPADLVIWGTGAVANESPRRAGLSVDSRGFALTRETLQSTDDGRIFVVGDAGSMEKDPPDKAGVFAVRQGPVLWDNLRLAVEGKPPGAYRPQRDFLRLVNLGDGRAVGQFRGRAFAGRWVWRWKDHIDRKFMAMYQDYSLPEMDSGTESRGRPEAMRCLGCGGKIGGELLREALKDLPLSGGPSPVLLGLQSPDDAAIVATSGNQVTVSTDFFASPVDDPALAGQIAVHNALSDLYVTGARPSAALALVQVPEGDPRGQLRMLRELMAAAAAALNREGVALAGGHTIEGERLAIGFTVLGDQQVAPVTKGGLEPGDTLILSRPLGTGILLAALMQNRLAGEGYSVLKESLLTGNEVALRLAVRFEIRAMTDVTGFGLAGHLGEMLRASGLSAELNGSAIPLLPGVSGLIGEGVVSTLAAGNAAFAGPMGAVQSVPADVLAAVLDPQTCGGILLGCRTGQIDGIMEELRAAGHRASVIGRAVGGVGKAGSIAWI